MTARKRVLLLIAIMSFSSVMIAGITTALLYHTSFETQKARLVVSAKARARLIEATARFNEKYNSSYPGGALQATLDQVTDAYVQFNSFGKTGELVLAKKENDKIVFLLSHGNIGLKKPSPISFDTDLAQPLKEALSGKSGAMVGLDYRGKEVLAAYEPVAILNFGLVTKVDMSEIREPFIRAGIVAGLFTLIFVISGAALFVRITNPIIEKLEERAMTFERLHEELAQEITEREYAEAAIQKIELRYRRLFDSMTDAFVSADMSSNILETNFSFESMLGYSKDELRQFKHKELSPSKWHALSDYIIKEQILVNGSSDIYQKEYIRKDGSVFPVEMRAFLMIDEKGEPAGIWAIVRDITERKRTEEALLSSQERYRSIYNMTPAMLHSTDESGVILSVSDFWLDAMGYERHEVIGKKATDFLTTSSRELAEKEIIPRFMEDGLLKNIHLQLVKKGGEVIEGHISMISETDGDGNFIRSLAVVQDITEQKVISDALQERDMKFERVLNILPVGVWIIDREGDIKYCNRTAQKIWGGSLYIGPDRYSEYRAWWPATGELLKKEDWAAYRALTEGICTEEQEVNIRSFDGQEKTILNWAIPVFKAEGTLDGAVAVNQDITYRKEMERELKEAMELAEAANSSKSQFLAVMSHEIRTPMNGIIGLTDLLLTTETSSDQKGYLDNLRYSAYSLLDIINDILDISKIEAGRLELEQADFNLGEVVRQSLFILNHKAAEKGIELITEIDPAIPEILTGDPVRIRQIILNLAGNSVKFTEKGEVRVSLMRNTEEESPEHEGSTEEDRRVGVTIIVRDTGIGIPEHKLASIFESFIQADEFITRKYGGTGLGLSISKRLAEKMGGTISVRSREGECTTFTVNITLVVPDGSTGAGPICNRERYVEWSDRSRHEKDLRICTGTILVAEDNPINMLIIKANLNQMGFTIIEASNGVEAVGKFIRNRPDLIFMDIHMPDMNGFEATRKIRSNEKEGKRTPIIALTADAFSDDRDKCLAEGMDFHLSKPFKPSDIRYVLEKFMPHATSDGENWPVENQPVENQPVYEPQISSDSAAAGKKTESSGIVSESIAVKQYRIEHSGKKIFDRTTLLSRIDNHMELYRNLIGAFIKRVPELLGDIDEDIDSGKFEDMRFKAHSLKGIALSMGAEIIAELSRRLENSPIDGNRHEVHIEEATGLCASLKSAFQDFLKESAVKNA